MQPYCFLCKKRCEIGVKCLHVPSNELKRKLWNESAGVEFTPHSRICENHFKRGDFYENATKRRRLRKGALPKQIEVKTFCYTEHIKVEFNTNKKDFSSQTEKEVVEAGIALENLRLQIKVKSLVTEVALLKQQLEEANLLNASISKIFSATELQHLRTGGQCHWNQDDISSSICLHAAGPRAYRQLYKKGFPLPHVSTLQKRSSKTKTKDCRQKKGSTSQKRSSKTKTKNCRQKKENSK